MNVFIIGATSGIGHALWKHYASKGNKVVVWGRRRELLDEMEKEFPETTVPVQCDLSDIDSFNRTLRIFPETGIDLVVICAGIGELNPELDIATELSTVATNVAGWTNTVVSVYQLLVRQGYGHMVALTSVGGLQPTPVAPSYSASKAFQINYVKSLQKKVKGSKIVVTEVRPGLVDTRMAKGEGLFWVMPLSKVTRQIIRGIEKRKRLLIVTRRWRWINYLLKHL